MPDLDTRIGFDDANLVARGTYLATHHPARFQPFIDGLAYQGIRIPAALAPFIKLPKPEPLTHRRARFAARIAESMAAVGYFTEEDAAQLGMTEVEVRDLKHGAWRCSGAERMAA